MKKRHLIPLACGLFLFWAVASSIRNVYHFIIYLLGGVCNILGSTFFLMKRVTPTLSAVRVKQIRGGVIILLLLLASCSQRTPSIDFTTLHVIESKTSFLDVASGYVFVGAHGMIVDENGEGYLDSLNVLFYIDKNTDIRFDYSVVSPISTAYVSLPIDDAVVTSALWDIETDTGQERIIGGTRNVLALGNGLFLIVKNEVVADALAKMLTQWKKEIQIHKRTQDKAPKEPSGDSPGSKSVVV